jgi:hypothetical protein
MRENAKRASSAPCRDWTSTGLDYYRTRDLVARDTNLGVEKYLKEKYLRPDILCGMSRRIHSLRY